MGSRASGFAPGKGRLGSIPAGRTETLRQFLRSVRCLAVRTPLRKRVVPGGRCRLASVLQRLLGNRADLRLDVDWLRRVVVANASLRTLGLRGQPMVLDSSTPLGIGV